ncbi:DUF192 domain-containing protein [Salipiger marinus]|jgi:uncharacterized protein|uniref:DUF192 domain-containing protein n=1 Tax=Salipiger marinus TaxID=555512 RepID=UPI000E8AEAFD|nr:DUF192 domain-containing protein [Salipiger manganoxidans]MCD1616678.1 DUF192 domain-containing protein [Salipiger manganoxidans]MEB3418826.1 DUF192 domain-containing protein [Salipiger manganoxidans]HBM57622.1 hypothetical protein [Citreicella sp.]|tara:strand:+ start:588 stop:1061 length:474 start_codon:yes stop_codon:yes gene_type:complete
MGNGTFRLCLSALAFALIGQGAQAACRDDTVWLRGDWGSASFRVEIADDAASRAQGLMHVEEMPASAGMLFVYEREAPVSFWMKNTLIPLDMVFADAQGRVVSVHDRAVPGDLTPIPSGAPSQFVLEINGGLADQLGIVPGSEMRHPAIAEPVWPCE